MAKAVPKFQPAIKTDKRFKAMFYGPAGAGKTTAAIQFPCPALIDTERGSENDQYVDLINAKGGGVIRTTDFDDIVAAVGGLLNDPGNYQTLIIDPLTIIYSDLLDKAGDEVGTDFGKNKGPANRKIKHLLTLLLRLDMNVVVTSHQKPKWVRAKDAKGKDTVATEGFTFDCYDSLDYVFDLVVEVGKRGKERVGTVKKTRIVGFIDGETFPFSYDAIADKYGRDAIERLTVPVALATAEQVAEMERLVDVLKVEPKVIEKWLDSARSENFYEMPSDTIAKCIDYLRAKIVAPVTVPV